MPYKKSYGPKDVAMFVDCNQVGKTKFYGASKVKPTPKFSKEWKADTPGTC